MLNVTGSFLGGKVEKMPHKVLKYVDSPPGEECVLAQPCPEMRTGLGQVLEAQDHTSYPVLQFIPLIKIINLVLEYSSV